MNKLEKFLLPKLPGYKYNNRFKWGEMYLGGGRGSDLTLTFERDEIYEEYDLLVFKLPYIFRLYIHFNKEKYRKSDSSFTYGFSVYEWEELHIRWNNWRKTLEFPWFYKWQKTEVLDYDGNIVYAENAKVRKAFLDTYDTYMSVQNGVSKEYPYKYILKNGTIQDRIAKVFVERMTWGMKWFPFIRMIKTYIDISFNEEVGERTGSWKGGCIGCSYSMLKGETPEQTLRRMEIERKF